MVALVGSNAAQLSLQAQSYTSQSETTFLAAKNAAKNTGAEDSVDISDIGNVLKGQRIDFLNKQLAELNKQIAVLRSFLNFANAGQAQSLRTGIADVGRQLQRLGDDIGLVAGKTNTSISIESIQGSFSESFNAAALGRGGSVAYSQQLEGEFSFTRITVEQEITSLSVVTDENGNTSLQATQSTTQSELIVASASLEKTSALITDYESASKSFDGLVSDALKAFDTQDGGINQLLSVLDEYIAKSKINLYA